MHRNLPTYAASASAVLCIGTGVAYVCTGELRLWVGGVPHAVFTGVPWLGWTFVGFAASTVLLLLWWARRRDEANERVWRGHCAGCGYNLRGCPGRCPECGRMPAVAVAEEDGPDAPGGRSA